MLQIGLQYFGGRGSGGGKRSGGGGASKASGEKEAKSVYKATGQMTMPESVAETERYLRKDPEGTSYRVVLNDGSLSPIAYNKQNKKAWGDTEYTIDVINKGRLAGAGVAVASSKDLAHKLKGKTVQKEKGVYDSISDSYVNKKHWG